jgi:DNA-binding transcriptional MerR regulator
MQNITLDDIKKAYFSLQDIDQLLDQYCQQNIIKITSNSERLNFLRQYDPDFHKATEQAKKDALGLWELNLETLTYLAQKSLEIAKIMHLLEYRVTLKTLAYN